MRSTVSPRGYETSPVAVCEAPPGVSRKVAFVSSSGGDWPMPGCVGEGVAVAVGGGGGVGVLVAGTNVGVADGWIGVDAAVTEEGGGTSAVGVAAAGSGTAVGDGGVGGAVGADKGVAVAVAVAVGSAPVADGVVTSGSPPHAASLIRVAPANTKQALRIPTSGTVRQPLERNGVLTRLPETSIVYILYP